MAITPLTLYFNTAPATTTNSGGATYTNFQIPMTGDNKVLAYALAAELLEFKLYQQAYLYLTGQPLPAAPSTPAVADALGYVYGTGSLTVGGTSVTAVNLGVSTSDPIAQYLAEFGTIENLHGQFLINNVFSGTNPYALTTGSVQFAFGLHTLSSAPNPKVAVAQAIYGAELTGVSAYTGAIATGYFSQKSPYLQIAASILGTEARHTAAIAASINAANGNGNIETAPFSTEGFQGHGIDVPLLPDQILNAGGSGVPGVLNSSGASVGGSGGTLTPVSGPNGAAVGPVNGTTTPTYNGFVYVVS